MEIEVGKKWKTGRKEGVKEVGFRKRGIGRRVFVEEWRNLV